METDFLKQKYSLESVKTCKSVCLFRLIIVVDKVLRKKINFSTFISVREFKCGVSCKISEQSGYH
jgi:hypothetical protein